MRLSNKRAREEFLENYRDWGIWKQIDELGLKFYRYQFRTGAVVKFHATVTDAEVKCNGPVDIEENTPLFALSFTIGDVEADGLRGSVYLYDE